MTLRRAPNGGRASAAEAWIRSALDDRFHFTLGFPEAQGWVVVPVESAQHFDKRDAECLARSISAHGKTKLRAVLLEDLKGVNDHLLVDATAQGLLLYSRECSQFNFALLPEDFSFAIVCTTNDYFLVAGPKAFVEIATGKEVADARSDFEEFAHDDFWFEVDRARLIKVSRRYDRS